MPSSCPADAAAGADYAKRPRPSAYAAAGWPHFGRTFAQCEHILHKARGQLFGDVDDECERGRWRHLLASDLVASVEAMDRRTAAALG